MQAKLIVRMREPYGDGRFADIVAWHLPRRLLGSKHQYKYRLAFIDENACVLRYDNEAGKGDHRHYLGHEERYEFKAIELLLSDFRADIKRDINEHIDHR